MPIADHPATAEVDGFDVSLPREQTGQLLATSTPPASRVQVGVDGGQAERRLDLRMNPLEPSSFDERGHGVRAGS